LNPRISRLLTLEYASGLDASFRHFSWKQDEPTYDLFPEFERLLSPVMGQHHVAGDKLFVDYSGKRVDIIVDPSTDVVRDAELFVGVLGDTCTKTGRSGRAISSQGTLCRMGHGSPRFSPDRLNLPGLVS
jgi:hypothetical protein